MRRSSTCNVTDLHARRCGERSWPLEREERREIRGRVVDLELAEAHRACRGK
jgi:hypothetical protein